MIVTEQTKNLPRGADPSDFNFLKPVIEAFKTMPTREKVTFPTENRGSVFADVEAALGYDSNDKPNAEFFFRSERHEVELAHTAVVIYNTDKRMLSYHLIIKPNKRLRSNGHKPVISSHDDVRSLVAAVSAAFRLGSMTRKVIPIKEKVTA